jgi:hypothetical protein
LRGKEFKGGVVVTSEEGDRVDSSNPLILYLGRSVYIEVRATTTTMCIELNEETDSVPQHRIQQRLVSELKRGVYASLDIW